MQTPNSKNWGKIERGYEALLQITELIIPEKNLTHNEQMNPITHKHETPN